MPLPFESVSHGKIAFGFFNIDSDMLLLERYFFFADTFCRHISDIAESESQDPGRLFGPVYYLENPEEAGDLMSAIYGTRYTGFIGEVYLRFPFPKREEDFKQKTDGYKTREIVKSIISEYSFSVIEVPFVCSGEQDAAIGEYKFSRFSFQELVKYVWQGGYPRWKDEQRPPYVLDMKNKVESGRGQILEGIVFPGREEII